ncbi:MAG: exodeoxyribonuclease VII large subunit [Gammaproteobacteria bacterium]|nr:exodeoxyribonuclease VII large subunit [Gammaproteobacteria bacterium]
MFSNPDSPIIYSVESLNSKINLQLQTQFNTVHVEGEISNLAKPTSGHYYFTLKDDKSQIKCALFQGSHSQRAVQKTVKFKLENGQKIIVRARLSIYIPRGEYQLIVDNIFPTGLGALQLAFEQLKQKLLIEGLFEANHKKSIPKLPKTIWVITSKTGAAIRDILITLKNKLQSPNIIINIIPTLVQGEGAINSILKALDFTDQHSDPQRDLIILARGGGSLEDLWAFNDENIARKIYALKTAIITGIGHETDFTIADFVSDLRAATPTAAAQAASEHWLDYYKNLIIHQQNITKLYKNHINIITEKLKYLNLRLSQQHPQTKLSMQMQQIDELYSRLIKTSKNYLNLTYQNLKLFNYRLKQNSPISNINSLLNLINYNNKIIYKSLDNLINNNKNLLTSIVKRLNCVNPLEILARGYSILEDVEGNIIKDKNQVAVGNLVTAKLHNGLLTCKIVESI